MQHTIDGKTFCITGTLHHYTRAQAEAAIREAGGKISKSVGKKTDFLVCGTAASRKLEKARSLGIPVIEEADLESFLAGESVDVDAQILRHVPSGLGRVSLKPSFAQGRPPDGARPSP